MLPDPWTPTDPLVQPVSILLVVPDLDLASDLQSMLGDARCTVHVVTSGGSEARRALQELTPDVALCHVNLMGHDRNGLVAFERQTGNLTPIIAVAPVNAEADAVAAVNAGALTCITLPTTPQRLRAAVERALELRRMMLASRASDDARRRAHEARRTASQHFAEAVDQLYMAWQPLINATSGELFGYEALVRSRAACCPSAWHVLDLASRLGRYDELEHAIVTSVAADIEAGGLLGVLTVNVNLQQLLRLEHAAMTHPLRRYASRIVLEVSEDGRIDDVDAVAAAAKSLRACGYRLAVDDLGTGFDYLARLLALEPEVFKLDRLALADCDRDERKRRYVGSVVKLAREEGAMVVAEGIERPEEAALAAQLGCDLLQGYLLGRPNPRSHWIEREQQTPNGDWLEPARTTAGARRSSAGAA